MIIVVPNGGNIIALEKALVMALKFLGNTPEIHAKNSRNTTLWNAYEDMGKGSISCWLRANSIIYAHFLSPLPRLKGFS